LTDAKHPTIYITGFEDVKNGFAGIYPVDTEDYEELRNSMEKLQLNDASLVFYRKVRH
jgi:GTP-binding protein LepA